MMYRGDPEAWTVPVTLIKERIDLENAKVLDIGFGAGGFSVAMAQQDSMLINLDISLEAVKRMVDRIRLHKMNNIHPQLASAVTLPYKENSFDLVILNGVLEYTARGQKGDPRETHVNVLKYVRKLLKPEGLFYLGIENRYYLKFLLGYRDHCEMRFSNVLPRRVSKFISKNILRNEVRNWIYSYNEYIELLKEAGFNDPTFYTALPNYKSPEYLILMEELPKVQDIIMNTHTKKLYKHVCYALAHSEYLYKKIGPDFVIISRCD